MESAVPSTAAAASSNTPASTAAEEEASTRRVANRIIRALQQHQLRLLHRSGAEFFVLGATGNVYTVTLSTSPACTCPDTAVPCKHILFVLLRALGLSLDEACVWRHSLRPCQVARLLATPTFPDVLAGARARERFHQLWAASAPPPPPSPEANKTADGRCSQESDGGRGQMEDGAACPVCLEELVGPAQQQQQRPLLTCRTCRNAVHAECFARWKRSRARRAATCVVCRSRWRLPRRLQEERHYVNLAAYMNDDNAMQCDDDGLYCAG
ncbi:hypothetical protein PR202_gb27677 [Eleusine coracana subsp. coracana]|uniref:Mitogen-activated protein kinase kinase kinase 1 n=1 Tax=Eleusine coracana subsp. coracana TaxID=191504 RepID=A0AAV5FV59_ELECO|nr:hypothetical protein QOZ80_6AG0542690 [Eleusine coracana subsp. coracana]GJN38617.1 hypothetical protein PR202_gb27677 [Eleusine coracana subsp. coracana]